MRKIAFFTIFIILIILSGCNDISPGRSDAGSVPVDISTVVRGEILQPGDEIEIEYTFEETDSEPDRLEIRLSGPDGLILREITVIEQPLIGWVPPIVLEETAAEGMYSAQFDFFIGEDLFYSEQREFFISSSVNAVKSINSYPPFLYPGGRGLFYADTDCSGDGCWLRWTLDGDVIAEGTALEGYGSIEIEAPGVEGVYDLSLEVFPFAPPAEGSYAFESTIKKNVPLYVNTEQKSGVTEFGPSDDFYTLFHFRGSYYNSADADLSEITALNPVGQPRLAVRNGLFGYYLDAASGFETGRLMVPVEKGRLEPFSFMMSIIPYAPVSGNLFYSGNSDGSFYISGDALSDGRLNATVYIDGRTWSLSSNEPMLSENVYSSVSLSVRPGEEELGLIWYLNGIPVSEAVYPVPEGGDIPWFNIDSGEGKMNSSLFGSGTLECLVDEVGVYHDRLSDGTGVDPGQYRRAMELEYGKFLMYAEGFDGKADSLNLKGEDILIDGSRLLIAPGASVEFPPIYPGYEEVVFRMELAGLSTGKGRTVFYADSDSSEIVSVEFSDETLEGNSVRFSLIFSADSVGVDGTVNQDGETGFEGDFSAVGFKIINHDIEKTLEIESILITRKNINISENNIVNPGVLMNIGTLPTGKYIRS